MHSSALFQTDTPTLETEYGKFSGGLRIYVRYHATEYVPLAAKKQPNHAITNVYRTVISSRTSITLNPFPHPVIRDGWERGCFSMSWRQAPFARHALTANQNRGFETMTSRARKGLIQSSCPTPTVPG